MFEHGQRVLVEDIETARTVERDAEQVALAGDFQAQAYFALPAAHGGDARVFLMAGEEFAEALAITVEDFALRTLRRDGRGRPGSFGDGSGSGRDGRDAFGSRRRC